MDPLDQIIAAEERDHLTGAISRLTETESERSARLMVYRASLKMPLVLAIWWDENRDDYVPPVIPIDQHKPITDTFPEIPRLVYRLTDVEQLSEDDVIACTALRRHQVRKALARAREMLKARLAS